MILSTRPTDRRQLIEEAAGVTKYKARRRAAELKLEAAQQNLTRIDDIVFEVEKQRGTLKRQAAKARRYQKLRDELRRLREGALRAEVPAARRDHRVGARDGLPRRASASRSRRGSSAEVELRARPAADRARRGRVARDRGREAAHARELELNRLQQQIAFDSEQVQIARRSRRRRSPRSSRACDRRREPAAAAPRAAAPGGRWRPTQNGTGPRRRLPPRAEAYEAAHREIEGLEADVEAARSEVFSAINAATALRHSLEHAGVGPRPRRAKPCPSCRSRPTMCAIEIGACRGRSRGGRRRAAAGARGDRGDTDRRGSRANPSWRSARIEHEWRARSVRAREHELAGLEARLTSLEELEAARAGLRRRRADGARAGQRQGQPAGRDRRLPRGRRRLRARGRSVSRRPAPARHRRTARARRGRPPARARAGRRTVRLPDYAPRPVAARAGMPDPSIEPLGDADGSAWRCRRWSASTVRTPPRSAATIGDALDCRLVRTRRPRRAARRRCRSPRWTAICSAGRIS